MENIKKPALILGNGPSLDLLSATDLEHFETYGTNHIYKKFPVWGRQVDNVVITDSNRLKEIGTAYKDFPGKLYIGDQRYIEPPYQRLRKIVGRDFIPLRQLTKETMPVNAFTRRIAWNKYLSSTVFQKWQMGFDYAKGLNFGRSVSCSCVQIAAIEGHKQILLTGIDARYNTPKDYGAGIAREIAHVNVPFTRNPRLMMEPFFVMLQIYLEPMGIELVDCTPGGALKFINKGQLSDFVAQIA
jgi:hypothetical protein